jgi:tripartite-type tricarboxylate transporter receptor subunit TctC
MQGYRSLAVVCAWMALAAVAADTAAQTFPNRNVRVVIGFAPGGANDLLARVLGPELGRSLGRQFVVDNRPGAAGTVAADIVAKAQPDGHTLLLGSTGTNGIGPTLYARLPYDQMRDLAPVTIVARSANLVVVNPALGVKDVRDLIALARSQPGKLNYGSSGNGSTVHLATELFKSMAGADIVHVPYKGDALALSDLIGGQVQVMLSGIPPAIQHVRAGNLRMLAVTSGQRLASLPDVPTVAETGLPGYDFSSWYGFFATGGTPPDALELIAAEVKKAIALAQVQKQYATQGVEPAASTPAEFRRFVGEEVAKWGKVVRSLGIRID